MRFILAALACLATPVLAQERPAPDYFLDAVLAMDTSQRLAVSCPAVSVNPAAAAKYSQDVLDRLTADGFDLSVPGMGMESAEAPLAARQQAFMAKHGLSDGAAQDVVCAAARAEIAEGTQIGQLLIEVGQ